jgi:hypothetical protein
MAKQRVGLSSFFSPDQKGFTEQFAEYAGIQRARKEAALGEIRKTLSEKQVYSAYAANVNKLLEDQVKQIAGSLDVDPTAYTDSVNDYLKYYNYSEQFKGFINDAAASYKADKEVDYNTALKAIQEQYVKTGNLDELEQNIINGVDAEKVLLETPGALKADEVIKSRLEKLGSVDKLVETAQKALKPEESGYPFIYQETDSIRQRINNAIEFDANGNIQVKDAAELERLGILDTMFEDGRVEAVVKQRLTSEGKEITEENKREALRNMISPFASGQLEKKEEVRMIEDPRYKAALNRVSSSASGAGEKGKSLELLSSKLDNMYTGVYSLAAGGTSPDWKTYRSRNQSPAGRPYTHYSPIFNGTVADISGKNYAIDGMFMDDDFNLYLRGREVIKGDAGPKYDTTTAAGRAAAAKAAAMGEKAESKISYGNQRVFAFDPGQISMESTTAGLRDDFNTFAAEARNQYRAFKQGQSTQAPLTAEEILRRRNQQGSQTQTEEEEVFNVQNR